MPKDNRQKDFSSVVYKVQTLVDGGLRVTLDLPETAIDAAAWLMECKRQSIPLKVSVKRDEQNKRQTGLG